MDHATPETVLGDFDDATLEHHGQVSRMFRRRGKYWMHTEGPDGTFADFEIAFVFGVEPLQQYLVEFERTPEMPETEHARLQVLRVSWDTHRKRWFYLDPPDVKQRLSPDDPLHWTGPAQNWNHMCASCHSTNVKKGFDVASQTYHTTFSEIDVSCEACHGPGSLHVEMAQSKSLFWDRHRNFGLKPLKSVNTQVEIETCAPCHSRRSMIHDCNGTETSYYDCYESELLRPETYYPDGQILDEVYVYGSFLQSKMYHKGIRCSDCHDPHTTKLRATGNQVCTSCHAHPAAKYDTFAHHNHANGSSGSACVECHMPASPFMAIDLRRDHSLRIPRPDLSVRWNTPNACTGCHLDPTRLPSAVATTLEYYADWLAAARDGTTEVAQELARLDKWSAQWCQTWYGDKPRPHFANAFAAAWRGEQGAADQLAEVALDRDTASIVRASALWELYLQSPIQAAPLATKLLSHRDPRVRAVAVRCAEALAPAQLVEELAPRLRDPVRLVRRETADLLASVPRRSLKLEDQKALRRATEELIEGYLVNADQSGAHLALGVLAERQGRSPAAIEAYLTAIRVQPSVTGPRSNLAQLLERQGDLGTATRLRQEELVLLARMRDSHPTLDLLSTAMGSRSI